MLDTASNDTLRGILIGTGITLLGVLCTQLVSVCLHYLDTKRQRTKLLREKCELISEHYCLSGLWWGKVGVCYTLWDLKSTAVPLEATKAAMLSSMYFPKLEQPMTEYYSSLLAFYNFLVDHAPAVAGPSTVVASIVKSKEFKEHDARIDKARGVAQKAIAEQARRLLKS
jgi:hypothetical protein